jgi:DNA-binding response OmpR family regulator
MDKILLVEDDEELATAIRAFLQMRKFVVKTVHTGEEALEHLKYGEFDAILLDWQLPDTEGIEICKQFRAAGGATPVLMMSGNSADHERAAGLTAGATDYMVKPFDFEKLATRLRELVNLQI